MKKQNVRLLCLTIGTILLVSTLGSFLSCGATSTGHYFRWINALYLENGDIGLVANEYDVDTLSNGVKATRNEICTYWKYDHSNRMISLVCRIDVDVQKAFESGPTAVRRGTEIYMLLPLGTYDSYKRHLLRFNLNSGATTDFRDLTGLVKSNSYFIVSNAGNRIGFYGGDQNVLYANKFFVYNSSLSHFESSLSDTQPLYIDDENDKILAHRSSCYLVKRISTGKIDTSWCEFEEFSASREQAICANGDRWLIMNSPFGTQSAGARLIDLKDAAKSRSVVLPDSVRGIIRANKVFDFDPSSGNYLYLQDWLLYQGNLDTNAPAEPILEVNDACRF